MFLLTLLTAALTVTLPTTNKAKRSKQTECQNTPQKCILYHGVLLQVFVSEALFRVFVLSVPLMLTLVFIARKLPFKQDWKNFLHFVIRLVTMLQIAFLTALILYNKNKGKNVEEMLAATVLNLSTIEENPYDPVTMAVIFSLVLSLPHPQVATQQRTHLT